MTIMESLLSLFTHNKEEKEFKSDCLFSFRDFGTNYAKVIKVQDSHKVVIEINYNGDLLHVNTVIVNVKKRDPIVKEKLTKILEEYNYTVLVEMGEFDERGRTLIKIYRPISIGKSINELIMEQSKD